MKDAVVRVERPANLRLVPDLPDDEWWEDDEPSGLRRALPLALALGFCCWGLLAACAFAVYLLFA